MRKYSENALNGSVKNSGRKCISRAQMIEPYELSQDLLDRQVEALSKKYGEGLLPHNAANTIQRAYRRYTMDKKFKAITSSRNNSENRLSRRFANIVNAGNCSTDSVDSAALYKSYITDHQDQVGNPQDLTLFHTECSAFGTSAQCQGNY